MIVLGLALISYLALSTLPVPLKVVLILLSAAALAFEIVDQRTPAWRFLVLDDEGLALSNSRGQEYRLSRIGSVFASPLFIGLRGRCQDGRHVTLGLFRGQIPDEPFRALTIALRNHSDIASITGNR